MRRRRLPLRASAAAAAMLLALALLAGAGCEFPYPWAVEPPPVQESVRDQACGATLTGAMEWNQLDEDFPATWNELCATRWTLSGELTESYDHDACHNCRCTYDVVAVVVDDPCGWYETGDETAFQLGLTPTPLGPDEFQDQAVDWPWLGYTSWSPSWDEGIELCYLGRDDEDALIETFDAGELYLYSYYYWNLDDGARKLKCQAWIGMSS